MGANAAAAIGPGMSPQDERAHQRRLAELHADEAEQAVEIIETKLAGMQQTLKHAKSEAARLRREANKLAGDE